MLQMYRLTERKVLENAGLEPVPGGELTAEVAVKVPEKKWLTWPWQPKGG